MVLLPLLSACRREPDATTEPDTAGVPPVALVSNVVLEAPSGGLVTATLVDPAVEVEADLDGEPLSAAWAPVPDAANRLWRAPDALALGPHTLTFTAGDRSESFELVVTPRWFVNVGEAIGLGGQHQTAGYPPECAQSLTGVGVADLDLDGDFDLVRGQIGADSQLYENLGDDDGDGLPTFVDRTLEWGFGGHDLAVSVSFADIDNDGDSDLFLGRRGPNVLLENRTVPDGVGRFVDVTLGSGLAIADQRTTSGGFGDFDGDGDLDLYEVNHTWCFPGADEVPAAEDHLYRNDGGMRFTEVTELLPDEVGQVSERLGFVGMWIDLERDGDPDLWVVNDTTEAGGRSVVVRNDGPQAGGWAFTDISAGSALAPAHDALGKGVNGMGGAVADLNGDRLPDFAFSNIGPNQLALSTGGGGWIDGSLSMGIERTTLPWGDRSVTWGTHLLDLDLDGDQDALYVGGPIRGREVQPHALFENVGRGAPMVDRTWASGLATTHHGAASAQVDLTGDGYPEVVVANWGGPLDVWLNLLGNRHDRHWLVVDAKGDGVSVNRDGFGAVIEHTGADGAVSTCFRNPMPGVSATGDPGCLFGLGDAPSGGVVTVYWPDRSQVTVPVGAADQRLVITRGAP